MTRAQRYLISLEYTLEEFWGVGRWGEYGAYRQMLTLYILNLVALGALAHLFTDIDVWALFPAIAALSIVTWIMLRASVARTRKECPPMEFLRGQSTAQARIRHAAVWTYICSSALLLFVSVWLAAY
jgi:hypothetical protein